jgi:hypothetical protein
LFGEVEAHQLFASRRMDTLSSLAFGQGGIGKFFKD